MPHYENVPFEVPSGWVWCRLGDVISIKSGDSIRVRDNRQGEYPIYGGNGINGYYSDCNVKPDTIVIGRVGFYCGSIHQTVSKAWVTDNAFIVSYESVFNSEYLCHLLEWLQLSKTSNSTAQPVISGKGIYSLLIPLPPLSEQERIVSEVKRCFTLIDQIEQGKSDLQTIVKQAKSKILDLAIHGKLVPQDLNDEPASELLKRINPKAEIACDNGHNEKLPSGWVMCKMKDCCKIVTGNTPSKSDKSFYGGSFPFYKPNDLDAGRHVTIASEYLTEKGRSKSRMIPVGTSAICCIGSIGKVGYIEKEGATNQQINCAIPHNCINTLFLYYLCTSDYFGNKLRGSSSAVTISIVNKSNMERIVLPIPPLTEQQRIVQKIEELFSVLDDIQNALEV